MTNLERAAAIAAERGWPLVETYRGWAVYTMAFGAFGAMCPHEMSVEQACLVGRRAGMSNNPAAQYSDLAGIEAYSLDDVRGKVDDFEAAREAMPATAFFGVPEEVAL